MTTAVDAIARTVARRIGQAVPMSGATLLRPDPGETFAMTFVKIVAEDAVQAIAYGNPDAPPSILIRWNPLSRESNDLAPFAVALDTYLRGRLDAGECPRVWMPHATSVHLADLLGRRYRRNMNASEELRTMGVQLRALDDERQIAGQQAVAVASELLTGHFRTGQSPARDRHLGSVLVWIEPPAGLTPEQVIEHADRIALRPAANMLDAADDALAENLRRLSKAGADPRARRRLERLLERAVRGEWDLLVRARAAWHRAAVPAVIGLDGHAQQSARRLTWNISNGTPTLSRPGPLARRLDTHQTAQDEADWRQLRYDPEARARATRTGHVFAATVTAVVQPDPRRRPCLLEMRVGQAVLRARRGTRITNNDGIDGIVREVGVTADGDWTLSVDVVRGVTRVPLVGARHRWMPANPPDLRARVAEADAATRDAAHPLATGGPLPAPTPRVLPLDLQGVTHALRTAP